MLLGAYQALERQIAAGSVTMHTHSEMLDLVVVDGKARGIVTRDLRTGAIRSYAGDAVVLATGGYGNVFYLSTNAKACNTTAIWRAHRRGAYFGNPCFTQIHPTCIPVTGDHQSKLTLMSESLRNDGRVWVPKKKGDTRRPNDIPEAERDYFLERRYPSFGNLVPRDVASRAAKEVCDEGRGVGPGGYGVYLDLLDAIKRQGVDTIREKYGNLFEIYERITGENAYEVPMRIYPAVHYTMGGLWVDYHLMSNLPGLFVAGEANFSDQGANRLGASALMQGLADGYFILPATVPNYLASTPLEKVDTRNPAFRQAEAEVQERISALLKTKGQRTVDSIHRELGKLMWDNCGMTRSEESLRHALARIPELREEFRTNVRVLGTGEELNQSLEKAGRLADFLELAELMCIDALDRKESCGGHFRVESRTPEGEAMRDDDNFSYVAAWEWKGEGQAPDASQGAADIRVRAPDAAELQVIMNITLKIWRQKDNDDGGPARHLPGQGGDRRHVFPGDARRLERRADRPRRRAGRVRPRLPRGHLRVVRFLDRRRGPRPAPRDDRLPASHAIFQGWRFA